MSDSAIDLRHAGAVARPKQGQSLIARLVAHVSERMRAAQEKRELQSLTDRELADIGLRRTDIELLFSKPQDFE